MRSLAAVRRRLRRGPTVTVLVVVGLLGAAAIYARQARPQVDVYSPVTVPAAYAGTTYAFDGLLCLTAGVAGAELREVARATTPEGLVVEVAGKPDGAPPTVAFPVEPAPAVAGVRVAAGDFQCLRLTTRPERTGTVRAPRVPVRVHYGPGGLLRRTVDVSVPVTLEVTGTGTDPRTTAGG